MRAVLHPESAVKMKKDLAAFRKLIATEARMPLCNPYSYYHENW
jgi:hypothetical protein